MESFRVLPYVAFVVVSGRESRRSSDRLIGTALADREPPVSVGDISVGARLRKEMEREWVSLKQWSGGATSLLVFEASWAGMAVGRRAGNINAVLSGCLVSGCLLSCVCGPGGNCASA